MRETGAGQRVQQDGNGAAVMKHECGYRAQQAEGGCGQDAGVEADGEVEVAVDQATGR